MVFEVTKAVRQNLMISGGILTGLYLVSHGINGIGERNIVSLTNIISIFDPSYNSRLKRAETTQDTLVDTISSIDRGFDSLTSIAGPTLLVLGYFAEIKK